MKTFELPISKTALVTNWSAEQEEFLKAVVLEDNVNMREELADMCWYIANYCTFRGYNFAELIDYSFDFEEEWESKAISSVNTAEDVRLFRWRSWFCIENLWMLENPQETEPDGLEFEVVGDIEGVVIKGFIDRYSTLGDGESLIVSDYKTGKTPRPQYQGDKFFQLYVYAYMLEKMGVGKTKELELLYLKDGVRLKKHVTNREAKNMIEHVIETKKQVDECCRTGEFEARKSILCNWCSYQEICPMFGGKK
jgi:RecB family exonuclease